MPTTACPAPFGIPRNRDTATVAPSIPIPKHGYGYNDFLCKEACQKTKARPKYRNDVDRPRGVHDYYNVMWDPHVHRGKTYKTFQEVERERAKILGDARKWQRRRRHTQRFSPIEIPKTPPPPPMDKYVVNLDQFLVENAPKPPRFDNDQQTDDIRRKKMAKPGIVAKIGFDVSTEILPGELFTFDEEAEPIAKTVGEKVLEQALRENMEEEELMALRQEQNEYEERRRLEALRLKRIEERCQLYLKRSERYMKQREAKRLKEESVETRVGARMFSRSYLTLLMPQLLQGLKEEGFFEYVDEAWLKRNFTPWINRAVETELCQQMLVGGVLDLMLQNLCLTRETEYLVSRMKEAGDAEIPGEGQDP